MSNRTRLLRITLLSLNLNDDQPTGIYKEADSANGFPVVACHSDRAYRINGWERELSIVNTNMISPSDSVP